MPPSMIEQELSELNSWHETITDLKNMAQVSKNGYLQYLRSRPSASVDSVKRSKELDIASAGVFTDYGDLSPKVADFLSQMKKYRPSGTIFEIGMKPSSMDYKVMKTKRQFHKNVIETFKEQEDERKQNAKNFVIKERERSQLDGSSSADIAGAFSQVITDKKRKLDDLYREPKKKKRRRDVQDSEFYIPYSASDRHTEEGLAVNHFATAAEKVQMDLTVDNEESRRLQTQVKKWDRKKKKMITINSNSKVGKIRTESGAWIPATYKTNRYEQWKEKSKIGDASEDEGEVEDSRRLKTTPNTHWGRHNQKLKEKIKGRGELKTPEQVMKLRKIQEKKKNRGKKGKGSKGKRKGR